jgi:hypothetical protein
MVRRDVFVVSTPIGGEDERFAILHAERMLAAPFPLPRSLGDWRRAFHDFVRSVAALREDELRSQLTGMGLLDNDIEDQIERARNLHRLSGEVAWECTTTLGYRNVYGQEVKRKTDIAGTRPYQRVYFLRCGNCGHEYGAEGCDIHDRSCPRCQGGASAQRITPIA